MGTITWPMNLTNRLNRSGSSVSRSVCLNHHSLSHSRQDNNGESNKLRFNQRVHHSRHLRHGRTLTRQDSSPPPPNPSSLICLELSLNPHNWSLFNWLPDTFWHTIFIAHMWLPLNYVRNCYKCWAFCSISTLWFGTRTPYIYTRVSHMCAYTYVALELLLYIYMFSWFSPLMNRLADWNASPSLT